MYLAKNKLSAKAIAAITKSGRYGDGDGLYLHVRDDGKGGAGSRSWVFVYHVRGKRKEMGLGSFARVSLTEARTKRDAARSELAAGRTPNGPLSAVYGGPTFGKVALALIADIEGSFKSTKHRQQWRTTLETYAAPIWDIPVDAIDTDAVLLCLKPIWGKIPETADRVRGRIERVLDVARVRGLRPPLENPAKWKGHLALILPPKKKLSRGHHPAMPYEQVPAFVAKLRQNRFIGARMLELVVLTAVRSGEAIWATRSEVDLDLALWTIPAERMKGGKVHRVPLVGRSLDIMRELCAGKEPDDFLFPGQKPGRPISNMTMDMLLRRMAVPYTVHGFRSSFRDWCAEETEVADEIAEQALAHIVGSSVRRAYRRGDALEKRRALMAAWDDHCAIVVIKLAVERTFGAKSGTEDREEGARS